MNRILLVYMLLVSTIYTTMGQGEWTYKKEKYDTKAYTRSHPDYSIDEYKIETILEADIADVISIMTEEISYTNMFKDLRDLSFIKQTDDLIELYLIKEAPFPARDRDGYFISLFSYDERTRTARIDITCPSTEHHRSGLVEITRCKGFWEFEQLEKNKIALTHQFIADPGGYVPAFILNMLLVNNPLMVIRDLRILLEKEDFKRKEFEFLKG